MREYVFELGTELLGLRVSEERNLYLRNSLTDYRWMKLREGLWGRDREKRNKFRLMMSKMPKLTEDELDAYLVIEMAKLGYKLKVC